jgi:cardiolipin synthase A/B
MRVHSISAAEEVELLDGGAQAYPRMLAAIAAAQRTIHLEVYAFDGDVGGRFADELIRAVGRGVGVKVILDGWGSARRGWSVAARLRDAGCEVEVYHRLRALLVGRFGRNHRKVLLVDDAVAFLGGINIGDAYLGDGGRPGWADLAVEIRGPAAGRLGQAIRREPRSAATGRVRVELSGLGGGWRLRRRYLKAFSGAQERILVGHGYFIPDRGLIRSLTAAARRGVEVRLLLAGRSDVPLARAAARSLYPRLLAAGINIHEWGGSVLHAKLAVVDRRRLLIGSFNLDPFSLANLETLVEVDDERVGAQAERWIDERYAGAVPVTASDGGGKIARWLLSLVGLLAAKAAVLIGRLLRRR